MLDKDMLGVAEGLSSQLQLLAAEVVELGSKSAASSALAHQQENHIRWVAAAAASALFAACTSPHES